MGEFCGSADSKGLRSSRRGISDTQLAYARWKIAMSPSWVSAQEGGYWVAAHAINRSLQRGSFSGPKVRRRLGATVIDVFYHPGTVTATVPMDRFGPGTKQKRRPPLRARDLIEGSPCLPRGDR